MEAQHRNVSRCIQKGGREARYILLLLLLILLLLMLVDVEMCSVFLRAKSNKVTQTFFTQIGSTKSILILILILLLPAHVLHLHIPVAIITC